MQIGQIGGIGPAATDFYYRSLIRKFASEDVTLDMTIVLADAPILIKNLMDDNKDAQVAIYEGLTQRLKMLEQNVSPQLPSRVTSASRNLAKYRYFKW